MKVEENQNQKNYTIDLIKTVAIILMVIGHSIQLFNGETYRNSESFYDNGLYKAIYSFHMPLFMMVNGYLYYYGIERKVYNRNKLISKLINYFIPIFTFATIKSILNCGMGRSGILGLVKSEVYNIFHVLWFLWAIIYSIALAEMSRYIINKFNGKKKLITKIMLIILLLCCFLFVPDILAWNVYKFVIPFWYIGYLCNKYKIAEKVNSMPCLSLLMVCWMILYFFYSKDCYIYKTGICITNSKLGELNQLFIDLYRWLIGFVGSIAIWGLIDNITKKIMSKHESNKIKNIGFIGKNTLVIYSFSTEILNELIYNITNALEFSYARTMCLSAFIIFICLFIAKILSLNKLKILSKLLTGK